MGLKSEQTAKFKTPALVDVLPAKFKARDLTDHHVALHLDMDRTVLTIILLGNFVEDLKYDEQCVILLIKFRFDLSLVDPTSRTLDVSVQVGLTFDKYSSEEVGLKGATVPIHYLGWAKNARYNINSYIDFYFCDSEEYLDIDMELVEFSIGKIVGNSDTDDSEVLVWMGVAYSVPYGSPSSARLSQNLTAEDPM